MEWGILVGVIGIGSFVGLIIFLVYQFDKQRTDRMAAVAAELGLEFSREADEVLLQKMQDFKLFNRGRRRKLKNVMKGETDIAVLSIFDYQFTTGGGNNSRTHHHTLVSMESKSMEIPAFSIRPESWLDKIGDKLGFQDIDFDHHAKFSNMFVLQGKDENAIRQFFNPKMLDFFAQQKGIAVEAKSGLFTYRNRGRKKPEEIRDFMAEGFGFYKAFRDRLR